MSRTMTSSTLDSCVLIQKPLQVIGHGLSYSSTRKIQTLLYFASGLKKAKLSWARLTHKELASHPMRLAGEQFVSLGLGVKYLSIVK